MKKIIDFIKRTVKPGPSRRNPLTRGQPRRLMTFGEHVAVLQRQFITPQNHAPVPTWLQSLAQLQAVT